ncbi:MAG: isoleucine--tRNA ligase [Alphaproteobacteria bacterium]|nr:MAG: isoleucine--tRNA ligase [Alphaproteobacteria bacterium]
MSNDYRHTIFLPKTDFPMKGNLPNREPKQQAVWEKQNLYKALRKSSKGREKYILHDGPPYANGDIHIGHVMNKVLKDVIVRSRQMTGYDAPYVPGWDCHGLPIEWKIEEKYRKKGKNKDEIPAQEFRQECRDFAAHWIEVQKEQFKRLGILGDWDNPYTTMAFEAEALIVNELLKFAKAGSLYQGSKPVMWSPVEKTALAEAEVEYHDHTSTQIWVRFPIIKYTHNLLKSGDSIIIWTTTPWTIPGNRGISYGRDIRYSIIDVKKVAEWSLAKVNETFVVATELLEQFALDVGVEEFIDLVKDDPLYSSDLQGTICAHPWRGKGYDFDVPLFPAGHVTTEQGTGFVHTAPGHGAEDFEAWLKAGYKDIPLTVAGDGRFYDQVPLVAGEHVYKVADKVCDLLAEAGALIHSGKLTHSYPHSWRSKAPLIFRNTPQWFISMSKDGLKDKALAAIEDVRWVPERSKNRIKAMVESKPDWVISRQRAWGVPITVFTNKKTGEILNDDGVNERILAGVKAKGADAWFINDPQDFLGEKYKIDDYEQCTDILDVWFDSGSTHAFVTEVRKDLGQKADLYIEGTDQHRGWFQSSLIESCATRGEAPYKEVMTHGFVLDSEGRKMSKSAGTGVAPQKIMDQYGADILRLWVVSTDYFEDVRIGQQILQGQVDSYRKIRNTFRFLLGNLNDFDQAETLQIEEMPELERWVLNQLAELDILIRQKVLDYDFNTIFQALYNFCILDLSSFYFDIRKDSFYCDAKNSKRRRAARSVLNHLFDCLTAWFAPFLVFTAEEVWQTRYPDSDSIHMRQFPDIPKTWQNQELADRWRIIRRIRRVATGALELDRQQKTIGSSLEASIRVYLKDPAFEAALTGIDFAEIAITSGAEILNKKAPAKAFKLEDIPNVGVETLKARGGKCARCWRVLPEVIENDPEKDICNRCSGVVAGLPVNEDDS